MTYLIINIITHLKQHRAKHINLILFKEFVFLQNNQTSMNWNYKTYTELTKDELYSMLRLRAKVFVVEQDCPYQDVDNKDQKAIHIFAIDKNEVVAYTRVFKAGVYFQEASIGRVVTKPSYRGTGLGKKLMQKTIDYIEKSTISKPIRISAQTYLIAFYEDFGFKKTGIEYMEDGIPHISMLLG